MAKGKTAKDSERPVIYLLYEGVTEKIFYENRIIPQYLKRLNVKGRDVKGNTKLLRSTLAASQPPFVKKGQKLRIYCCTDNDATYKRVPDFDLEPIRNACKKEKLKNVLSVDAIVANQELESWFFYDLDGIYDFLVVPEGKRKPKAKYKQPQRCSKEDLKTLFHKHGKSYRGGKRSTKFIKSLDIKKIVAGCKELREGIALIKAKANDLTNDLFS